MEREMKNKFDELYAKFCEHIDTALGIIQEMKECVEEIKETATGKVPFDKLPITELEICDKRVIGTKFKHTCCDLDISTIGDLIRCGYRHFYNSYMCGRKTADMVRDELLRRYGVEWR